MMAGVVHKKNFQYTKVITGIKITGLTIYNSYQLMGINRSKSVHFIVLPLTFSPYICKLAEDHRRGDFLCIQIQ